MNLSAGFRRVPSLSSMNKSDTIDKERTSDHRNADADERHFCAVDCREGFGKILVTRRKILQYRRLQQWILEVADSGLA